MDVDATVSTTLTEEDKKNLGNACYYCLKPGHFAKDCHKKKRDRAQAGGSGGHTNVKATDTEAKSNDLIDLSTDQITDKLAGYLKSEQFLGLDDDTKMSVVNQIAPPGF